MSNTADNAVKLWELLRNSPETLPWDTVRDMLRLTDDEMRAAVALLNEVLQADNDKASV